MCPLSFVPFLQGFHRTFHLSWSFSNPFNSLRLTVRLGRMSSWENIASVKGGWTALRTGYTKRKRSGVHARCASLYLYTQVGEVFTPSLWYTKFRTGFRQIYRLKNSREDARRVSAAGGKPKWKSVVWEGVKRRAVRNAQVEPWGGGERIGEYGKTGPKWNRMWTGWE